ncbi:hypothetical protein JR316_0003973 [Psilocybe cubensis]|uniref:Uncharacterized protein n=2 Tax=Psilocybe cubensis TaxID=181762 RepID=A0A8H7Y326_PSICU|nr:hypothetical protein JR316_0003973 [Psilocybe cubensis]KAH9484491.1 hypothetical protein JR316_0003973 [Psilocybe cubensis]
MSQNAWKEEVLARYGLTETDRLIYDAFTRFTGILEAPKSVLPYLFNWAEFLTFPHRKTPAAPGTLEYRWRGVRNMIAKRSIQDYFWRYCTIHWVPEGNVGTVERQQSVAHLMGIIAPEALTAALVRHGERSREGTPALGSSSGMYGSGSQESGHGVFNMDFF